MNKEILSLKEIQENLKDKRLYIVAKKIGLSYPTLKRLVKGNSQNYNYKTLKLVSDYILNQPTY